MTIQNRNYRAVVLRACFAQIQWFHRRFVFCTCMCKYQREEKRTTAHPHA